jgi:hypothetical protein
MTATGIATSKPSCRLRRFERLATLRAQPRLRKLGLTLGPGRSVGALAVDARCPFATPFAEVRAAASADKNSHRLDSGATG